MQALTAKEVAKKARVVSREALGWAAALRGAVRDAKLAARAEVVAAEEFDSARYVAEIVAHDKALAILRAVGRTIRTGDIGNEWSSPSGRQLLISTGLSNQDPRLDFQASLRSTYAAGKEQRIAEDPDVKYKIYRTMRDSRVRDAHKKFDGLTLPKDHPIWNVITAPNDPRCRCGCSGASEQDVERLEARGVKLQKTLPDIKMVEHVNKTTGERTTLPEGVAPGWGVKPGTPEAKAALVAALVAKQRKLVNTPLSEF